MYILYGKPTAVGLWWLYGRSPVRRCVGKDGEGVRAIVNTTLSINPFLFFLYCAVLRATLMYAVDNMRCVYVTILLFSISVSVLFRYLMKQKPRFGGKQWKVFLLLHQPLLRSDTSAGIAPGSLWTTIPVRNKTLFCLRCCSLRFGPPPLPPPLNPPSAACWQTLDSRRKRGSCSPIYILQYSLD